MFEIVLPTPIAKQREAANAIGHALDHSDSPVRFLVVVDGGKPGDLPDLESMLKSMDSDQWHLTHEEGTPVGRNACIQRGARAVREKFFILLDPRVVINDPMWLGKLQQVWLQDHRCASVDTEPNTKSTTLPPVKRPHQNPPEPGCLLAALQTDYVRTMDMSDVQRVDFVWMIARSAMLQSLSGWNHPGVRYQLLAEETECHERSEPVERSESPSPMTPISSSATTTAKDGFGGL